MDIPVKKLPVDQLDKILYGSEDEKIYFRYKNEFGQVRENYIDFEGVIGDVERRFKRYLPTICVSKWKNIWQSKLPDL